MSARHSLGRTLRLQTLAILGAAVVAIAWAAHRRVERVLVETTGARLEAAARELSAATAEGANRQRQLSVEAAQTEEVRAYVAAPSDASARAAMARLEAMRARTPAVASLSIWNAEPRRLLSAGAVTWSADRDPSWIGTADVSPLIVTDSGVVYHAASPVLSDTRDTLGWVLAHRIIGSSQTARQVNEVSGGATLLLGNADGSLWTDLTSAVPAPADSPHDVPAQEILDPNGIPEIAFARGVVQTPWVMHLHIPRSAAVAPAKRFLLDLVGIVLAVLIGGALLTWALSRHISVPISALTEAAEEIAKGNYARRVSLARKDELGRLAASFDTMAERVSQRERDLGAANEALRESQNRFRGLVESAHEGICTLDPAGAITYANPRLAEMLGYDTRDLVGKPLFAFMDPQVVEDGSLRVAHRERGRVQVHERPMRRRSGSTLWTNVSESALVDAKGEYAGAICLLSDLTARREAEERLRSSERHFRALIEGASDMICILEPDGAFRYVSPALERLLGYSNAELIGRPGRDFLHPEDAPRTHALLQEITSQPRATESISFRYRHRDGSWRHVDTMVTNLIDDPDVGGIVANMHDVTAQQLLQQQLAQAQKMEAVGQLAGGIAHDFNNLLTVVTSYSGMLLGELPADAPMRADVQEIADAAERAATLTRQLLAFSRQQVLQPRVLDLNQVVDKMRRMLGRLVREDVRLVTTLQDGLAPVFADPGQLEQVIVNLAVNARDAMPEGGMLTISTANVEVRDADASARPGLAAGTYVRLSVRDTGVGMDAATKARMFEPFYSTKGAAGTGLGLSTVYGIVAQSGGALEVSSEPGAGTTVDVYLPRASAPAEQPPRSDAAGGVQRGSETVLLVEDEAAVRTVARRILERAGYTVLEARSGPEALALVDTGEHRIDLLLSDMVMPEMSGRDLSERLKSRLPALRTVFMSGYTEDTVLRRGAGDPDAVFVQKPFTTRGLTEKLREALGGQGLGTRD